MQRFRCRPLLVLVLGLAACTPGLAPVPGSVASSPTAGAGSTVASAATTSGPPAIQSSTSTTSPVFPDAGSVRAFLESVPGRPDIVESSAAGYRVWPADRAGAGEPVQYPDIQDGLVRFAVGTAAGVVYAGADGGLHLGAPVGGRTEPDETVRPSGTARFLQDVAMTGSAPVAIVIEAGGSSDTGRVDTKIVGAKVVAVDVASGDRVDLYDAAVDDVVGASYGGGTTLVVKEEGDRRAVHLIVNESDRGPIDILTAGQPDSAVLSPDGSRIFFTVLRSGVPGSSIYTFGIGTEGPALEVPIPVDAGQWVCDLDTDGRWVAGAVHPDGSDRVVGAFLYDLEAAEAYVTDVPMRLTLSRAERTFVRPGDPQVIDGRFFGYLEGLRAAGGAATLAIDYAEYLTGDSASRAAEAAGEASPPPNGYFIRNTDPTVRRIPVAPDARVSVVANFPEAGPGLEPITVEQWVRLVNGDASAVDFDWFGAGTFPYWVTIEAGIITAAEEVQLS